jgi:peptide/nickel transport system ATP-binding protein
VVADIADDMLVMYAGKPIETGSSADVFFESSHPYTWGLLRSMPRLDRGRENRLDPIPGSPPSLIQLPGGCAFHPRCPFPEVVGGDRCRTEMPELYEVAREHHSRCFLTAQQRADVLSKQAAAATAAPEGNEVAR